MNSFTEMQQKIETEIVYGSPKDIGVYAMASAANFMAAQGVMAFDVCAKILIPDYAYRSRIHTMRKHIERVAEKLAVEHLYIEGEVSPAVNIPAVVLCAAGMAEKVHEKAAARAGQEIVLTKWVGMEGMLRIVNEKEKELSDRFTPAFIKQIKSYETEIFALREIEAARAAGVSVMRQVGEGGIFAGLWKLALEAGTGISADIKKLSILQETIEVCEHFRLNPYQLTSAGCMLMVTDDGKALADVLEQQGITVSVIGTLTDANDKALYNGEEVRYIDRPAPDELTKLYIRNEK